MPKPLSLLSAILILLYAAIIAIGFFMPLQTDEIAWSIPNNRAIVDHYQLITLLPQCQTSDSFAKALPLLWYPYAWTNDLLFMHIDQPIWIRIVGIIRFLLFLTASWFIIKPIAFSMQYNPRIIFILFLAMLGLDELPLLMQVARPEQTLLLSIAVAIALALNADTLAQYKWRKYAALATFLCTILLLYPAHPKAIVTLPLMIICGAVLFHRLTQNKLVTAAAILFICYFSAMSVSLWIARYDCPHSALSANLIAQHSLPLNSLRTNPLAFFVTCIEIFCISLLYDFDIHFHILKGKDWLPTTVSPLPEWYSVFNTYANYFTFEMRLLILAVGIIWLKQYICRQKILTPLPILLGAILSITIAGFMLVSGSIRMWYAVALETPLLMLASLLFFPRYIDRLRSNQWFTYLIALFAIGNMLGLSYRYYPFITTPTTRELALSTHRPILLSAFGYNAQKNIIMSAYVKCGLPPLSKATHLVLDDYTYPVLRQTKQPFSFDYFSNINSDGIKIYNNARFSALLKEYHSDGIIMDCREVPESLRPLMSEYNGYCCAKAIKAK